MTELFGVKEEEQEEVPVEAGKLMDPIPSTESLPTQLA